MIKKKNVKKYKGPTITIDGCKFRPTKKNYTFTINKITYVPVKT